MARPYIASRCIHNEVKRPISDLSATATTYRKVPTSQRDLTYNCAIEQTILNHRILQHIETCAPGPQAPLAPPATETKTTTSSLSIRQITPLSPTAVHRPVTPAASDPSIDHGIERAIDRPQEQRARNIDRRRDIETTPIRRPFAAVGNPDQEYMSRLMTWRPSIVHSYALAS